MQPAQISVRRAIWTGKVVVTAPPLAALLAGAAFFYFYVVTDLSVWVLCLVSVVAPLASGWLWWSFASPRWRVWALERVEDWDGLMAEAVGSGVLCSPGHWVERTEIRTRTVRERERGVGWSSARPAAP